MSDATTTTSTRVISQHSDNDHCYSDKSRAYKVAHGIVVCGLLTLLGFGISMSLYDPQSGDAHYYARCVRAVDKKHRSTGCTDMTDGDCRFGPRRACAIRTVTVVTRAIHAEAIHAALLADVLLIFGAIIAWEWVPNCSHLWICPGLFLSLSLSLPLFTNTNPHVHATIVSSLCSDGQPAGGWPRPNEKRGEGERNDLVSHKDQHHVRGCSLGHSLLTRMCLGSVSTCKHQPALGDGAPETTLK